MKLSVNLHLSKQDIIKNGSIFTPNYIVDLIVNKIKDKLNKNTIIIDFGAGYGAFCSSFIKYPHKQIIATDYDKFSISFINQEHKGIKTICENSLLNVNKSKYCNDEDIIVIGNPPYNDITSQYKKGKKGFFEIDEDIYARDLGICFLKMYDKIKAKYVCVLHPLSYLSKKNNFKSLGKFNKHYRLINGTLFSSKHFESIKRTNLEFPVVAALYERNDKGMNFEDVLNFKFEILGTKKKFIISSFNTIDGLINKYPDKNKSSSDLQFYTIRDINALHRNKTFLVGQCNNGIKITNDKLYYYAWLDLFKKYFNAGEYQYLFGNLSPLLTNKINNPKYQEMLISYILNENNVVNSFYLKQDPEFLKKYGSIKYDKSKLIKDCLDLAVF